MPVSSAAKSSPKRLAFTVAEYRDRLQRLQSRLREAELDGLLVNTPENITYLTGFQTPGYYAYQGLLVPVDGDPVLVCRHLEAANVDFFAWIDQVVPVADDRDPVLETVAAMSECGMAEGRIGAELDSWFLTVRQLGQLREAAPAVDLVDASGTVESLRVIKSAAEIEHIRSSCRQAEAGIEAGIAAIRHGGSENEVAAAVYSGVILAGGEYPGLAPFVLAGARTLIPHGTWGGGAIETGDVVYFEVCGTTFRYTGARMHSVVLGQATDRQKRVAEASIAGVLAAVEAIAPGVSAGEVDRACREAIGSYGFGADAYRHRCGYSIGVAFPPDWGEGQILSLKAGEERLLESGMTFHVPPLVFDEEFGIGFSHSLLVTDVGCEPLTALPLRLDSIED
ncbi:MAG: aminopeptidase P family protein [Actinobacteria bacterium]|nr:aminopeptidase P family protein [Actinomycetota bacterium]